MCHHPPFYDRSDVKLLCSKCSSFSNTLTLKKWNIVRVEFVAAISTKSGTIDWVEVVAAIPNTMADKENTLPPTPPPTTTTTTTTNASTELDQKKRNNWNLYNQRTQTFIQDTNPVVLGGQVKATHVPLFLAREGLWEQELEDNARKGVLRQSFEDQQKLRSFVNNATNQTPTSPTRVFVSKRKRKRPRRPPQPRPPVNNGTAQTTVPLPLPPLQHFATNYRRGFTMGVTPRGENPLLVHNVKWELEYAPNAITCGSISTTELPLYRGTCVLYNEPDGLLLVQWHDHQSPFEQNRSKSPRVTAAVPATPMASTTSTTTTPTSPTTPMDYLAIGQHAIRLVTSKRRGRAADPVYVSAQLRLSALAKIEHHTATGLQRWYRHLIDLRVWLPALQQKANDRRDYRAALRIQKVMRRRLAWRLVHGPRGMRVRYTAAAKVVQRVR